MLSPPASPIRPWPAGLAGRRGGFAWQMPPAASSMSPSCAPNTARSQGIVQSRKLSDNGCTLKSRGNHALTGGPKIVPQYLIRPESPQCISHRTRISTGGDQACLTVPDDIQYAAHWGCHDRPRGCHCLYDRIWESLADRAEDADIKELVKVVRCEYFSQEVSARRDSKFSGECFKCGSGRAVAYHQQMDVRISHGYSTQQRRVVLDWRQSGYNSDHKGARRCAPLPAARSLFLGTNAGQCSIIDEIGYDYDFVLPDAFITYDHGG